MILPVVLLSIGFTVRAQTPAPSPTPAASASPSLEKEFFKNILRDQKAIWTAPFRVHSADAKWMLPSGVGTMALIATDRITGDELAEFDHLGKTSRILSYPGSIYGSAAVAASFYLLGRTRNDSRARETGILSAQGAIDSLIVVSALKGITQRGRPRTGRDRSEFFDGGNSFPSGHSAQAWAVATIIANEYHDHRAVQAAAYSIASMVSIARFTSGKHYLSDIVVGSALGYGIGKYVYRTHHRELQSDGENEGITKSHWPLIAPSYHSHPGQYGVELRWSF